MKISIKTLYNCGKCVHYVNIHNEYGSCEEKTIVAISDSICEEFERDNG